MKQHYKNYEPTLKALRQKYEVKEQGDISYIFLWKKIWQEIKTTRLSSRQN